MHYSIKAGILLSFLVFVLLFAGTPAFSQDNATITGDSVRLRAEPSTASEVIESMNKGTRVEVQAQTDVSTVVDGYTADWFMVKHGGNVGFVFGRYLRLDPGVTVPLSTTGPQDPVGRFVAGALKKFGRTEDEVIKTLGKPLNTTEKPVSSIQQPGKSDATRELSYVGLVVGIYRAYGGEPFINAMTVTDTRYKFDGIGVGSPTSEVNRVLGVPTSAEGSALVYYDQETGFYTVTFTVRNGVVTGIQLDIVID